MKYIGRIQQYINYLKLKYPYGTKREKFVLENYSDITSDYLGKKGVIFMCDGKFIHGGLTDRIRGILTTFYISKFYNLPFYIYWITPFKLTQFLVPNNIDWRISENDIVYNQKAFPVILERFGKNKKFENFFNDLVFKSIFINPKHQMHVYSNLDFAHKKFKKLYNELFKPAPLLKSNVDHYLTLLENDYISFSFRFTNLLGDFKDVISTPLSLPQQNDLINKNIQELRKFLDIYNNKHILITSDSTKFLNSVKEIDQRIFIVPGNTFHLDQTNICDEEMNEVWLKTFIDQYLIMNAKRAFLFRTGEMYSSGFAKFAALIGNVPFKEHTF